MSSLKHAAPDGDVHQASKKARTAGLPRLNPTTPFAGISLDTIEKADIDKVFENMGAERLRYCLAKSTCPEIRPAWRDLQIQYITLKCHDLANLETTINEYKKDKIFKINAATCVKAISSFGDIFANATLHCPRPDVAYYAMHLRCAFINELISGWADQHDFPTMYPDLRKSFSDGIEYLTAHGSVSVSGGQSRNTTASVHPKPSDTQAAPAKDLAAPPSGIQSADTNDVRSDEYLKARLSKYKLDLDGMDLPDWSEIRGLDTVKRILETEYRGRTSAFNEKNRPKNPPGMLLHGPQGVGKSSIAFSFAKKYNMSLWLVGANILGSLQGETTKLIDLIFSEIKNDPQPVVLLLDEADGLLKTPSAQDTQLAIVQSHLKTAWQLLSLSKSRVFVIGTTTVPWRMEMEGFRRCFRNVFYVPMPDEHTRRMLLDRALSERYHNELTAIDDSLVSSTTGLTASDIESVFETIDVELQVEIEDAQSFGWVSQCFYLQGTTNHLVGHDSRPEVAGPG